MAMPWEAARCRPKRARKAIAASGKSKDLTPFPILGKQRFREVAAAKKAIEERDFVGRDGGCGRGGFRGFYGLLRGVWRCSGQLKRKVNCGFAPRFGGGGNGLRDCQV